MIIAGWSTFATQAAIAWCLARRVPYLLLTEENDPREQAGRTGGWQHLLVGAVARRAAGVLAPEAGNGSMVAYGVCGDRHRTLPQATDAAATHVHELARSAWASSFRSRAQHRASA
jgi:hypothetical protein